MLWLLGFAMRLTLGTPRAKTTEPQFVLLTIDRALRVDCRRELAGLFNGADILNCERPLDVDEAEEPLDCPTGW